MAPAHAPSATTVRPFAATDADYEAVAAVTRAAFPELPFSAGELRFEDDHHDPKCRQARWVACMSDGRVVGWGEYTQHAGRYHPRKFFADVVVHPEHEGRGVGSAVYDTVMAALSAHDPLEVRANTQEDQPRGLAFLHARGFREEGRMWESRLDVAQFDPAPYAGVEAALHEAGILIRTYADLADDPARDRKLYDLVQDVREDMPTVEPATRVDFDVFMDRRLRHPSFLPDATFVAVDARTGAYAGYSSLRTAEDDPDLHTDLTGTARAYRRRGLALALKLRAVGYARAHSAPGIVTHNDSTNHPMLAINERLGFVRRPAWIDFVKVLGEETA